MKKSAKGRGSKSTEDQKKAKKSKLLDHGLVSAVGRREVQAGTAALLLAASLDPGFDLSRPV